MTSAGENKVRFTFGNWIALVGLVIGPCVTLATLGGAAYVRHDRMLTAILERQASVINRVERIEASTSLLEIDARVRMIEMNGTTKRDMEQLEARIDRQLELIYRTIQRVETQVKGSE